MPTEFEGDGASRKGVSLPLRETINCSAVFLPTFGSVDKDLKYDADGGVTFRLQADAPGKGEKGNWLPTPRGQFNLFLRAYLPGEALIKQDYVPPAVERL